LSRGAGILAKLRHFVEIKIIYYSIVNSHLLYGILSWGGGAKLS